MKRRDAVLALCALCALPLAAFAQPAGKIWRVGFLVSRRRPDSLDADIIGAFPRGMRELGYIEGKNLLIEWRFADGLAERLAPLAAELVRIKVDVIVTNGTPATDAARKATPSLPIIMGTVGDPVGNGLVKSLARPGGNITGLSNFLVDSSPKLLELLLSAVPNPSRVAILLNPVTRAVTTVKQLQHSAQSVNMPTLLVEARDPAGIDNAFTVMNRERVSAVVVVLDGFFSQQRRQISELAIRNQLPSINASQEYPEAGGLMSYGQNLAENFRRAATFVDKILKGADPAVLPVEQSTKLDLVINLKTAKALGITFPQSVLLLADRVIE